VRDLPLHTASNKRDAHLSILLHHNITDRHIGKPIGDVPHA
jgi:hypothetical protein